MTRKQFLRLSAVVAGVIALPVAITNVFRVRSLASSGNQSCCYRIRPLTGGDYSTSFVRLCQRSRFRTVAAAVASVRAQSVEFEVYRDVVPKQFALLDGGLPIIWERRPKGKTLGHLFQT